MHAYLLVLTLSGTFLGGVILGFFLGWKAASEMEE